MNSFISIEDRALTDALLTHGYVIARAQSQHDLNRLRDLVRSSSGFADLDHARPQALNDTKLTVMQALNAASWTREAYFRLAEAALYALIGNELAMQKKFNINVQVPQDATSLLPVHADTWTGDSAYQLVLWVPLVDCYGTKAMYILPPGESFTLEGSSEDVWNRIKGRVRFIDINYGDVLIFNSTLPHGNRVNAEPTTRWSLNCRFKAVWTPYAVKGAGEHFEPITLRAAARVGLNYRHPV